MFHDKGIQGQRLFTVIETNIIVAQLTIPAEIKPTRGNGCLFDGVGEVDHLSDNGVWYSFLQWDSGEELDCLACD